VAITSVSTTAARDIRSLDTPPSSSEPVYPPPDPCSSPQTTTTTITLYPKAPAED
jgi:hypothetical protein